MNEDLIDNRISLLNAGHTKIEQLFLAHIQINSNDFNDFLDLLEYEDWKDIIPELTPEIYEEYMDYSRLDLIMDYNKLGYIAQCDYNLMSDFSFTDDGRYSCVNTGTFYEFYVYADTVEELLEKVLAKDKEFFDEQIREEKEKLKIK